MTPQVETERLILRPHKLEDFATFATHRADPAVMRYMRSGPIDEEEAWSKFQSMAGHWQFLGYGNWAIEEKASGTVIGSLGFSDKKRPASHPASGAPEMGWLLGPSPQGKGYATEAVLAALVLAREHFSAGARVVCVIDTANIASQRVAAKCGFRQFANAERDGHKRFVYERNL